jgi:hypothetical protein
MDVEASPTGSLVAGIFVASSRGYIELGLFESGKLAYAVKTMSRINPPENVIDWPKGAGGKPGRARLAIEAVDTGAGRFRLYVNGNLAKTLTVDTLANVRVYQAGAFCRAQIDDEVKVALDNATLVTKKAEGDVKKSD